MPRPSTPPIPRTVARSIALSIAATITIAAVAHAAEVVAAEVDGTENTVTVEQGSTATFAIKVKATGAIRCTATRDNPATASVNTAYAISSTGTVSVASPSPKLSFWSGLPVSGGCQVTWDGDPTWLEVNATVSAASDAPLGDRMARLRFTLTTPFGPGNSTLKDESATFITFKVVEGSDKVAPDVDCDGPWGLHGNAGWWLSDVWYSCTASDAGVGLASSDDATFTLETSGEGQQHTGWRSVSDRAGNTSTAGPYGSFDVDRSDPSILVDAPSEGESFVLGSAAAADFSCSDTASGVASCDGPAVLDTSSVGTKTFTATASDVAGRSALVTRTYRVVYAFGGLSSPGGRWTARAGAAIPLRWSLGGVSDLSSFDSAWSKPCDATDDAAEQATTPGSSGLTYDPELDRFQWIWKTSETWNGCRTLILRLNDGTDHRVDVTLR